MISFMIIGISKFQICLGFKSGFFQIWVRGDLRSDHDGGRCSIAADVGEGGRGADGYEFDVENVDDGDKSMMIFKNFQSIFCVKKIAPLRSSLVVNLILGDFLGSF
jgi:hypothetical protein